VREACTRVEDQYIKLLGNSRYAALPRRVAALR